MAEAATFNTTAITSIQAINNIVGTNIAAWNNIPVNTDIYCSQYRAVYNAFGTKPQDSSALAQNTFVKKLVDDGTWAKLDVMWVQSTNTFANALINWVSPGNYTCTSVGTALTFIPYQGMATTNTSSNYLDTRWSVANNGVKFTLNDEAAGYYSRTSNQTYCFGTKDTSINSYVLARNTTVFQIVLDSSAGPNITTTRTGSLIGRRASNVTYVYGNSGLIGSTGTPGGTEPVDNMHIFGYNDNSTHTGNAFAMEISMVFLGGGFTSADVSSMFVAFEAYMDSNGKGVV